LPIISKSNYDYIIIAKQQILELDYNKIYNDIKRLLIN
jgi:RNase P protein component